ncbi:hypothetical protein ASPFODRAFT_55255 [Aspergillus luchuensis CBS 106.47]|uniref:RTA1 domain protein n=2 Tax=Aspergillus kawachii TaxID=1069201 RepID=A0A146G3M9_ASPKA|nr:hypothetical protein ASPFODRAFT_55255 [Aspergillus luchuensis CBS 106.47]GAA92998.1 RTA1 domain protein [Aspergillus luchuensis IFO 4308]GAT31411.1 RTA1 domain protein [Aspergillus luchuensis]
MSTTTASISTTTSALASTQTCTNPKPGKNGYLPPEACDDILLYVPSLAAAVLFCVLYGLTLICHGVQAFLYKKVYITPSQKPQPPRVLTNDYLQRYAWVIIMGATWELIAFIFRALLTRQQNNSNYDTVYTIMFLLAPLWINAFLYMTLGRLIYFFIPDQKLAGITARRYGRLFVWLDIFAFLVQLGGAAITTQTDVPTSTIMLGVHIYMGGIGLQELFILIFTGLIIHLHQKLIHLERAGILSPDGMAGMGIATSRNKPMPWRWLFYVMYTALGMITIRIIFRLCQYAQGTDPSNPVLTHEAYEYVFDAVPMFIALVLLNVVHPGRVLQGPESEFPRVSRAEKKRVKMEKKQAKRERKEAKRLQKETRKGYQSGWWWNMGRERGSETFEILPMQEGVEGRV